MRSRFGGEGNKYIIAQHLSSELWKKVTLGRKLKKKLLREQLNPYTYWDVIKLHQSCRSEFSFHTARSKIAPNIRSDWMAPREVNRHYTWHAFLVKNKTKKPIKSRQFHKHCCPNLRFYRCNYPRHFSWVVCKLVNKSQEDASKPHIVSNKASIKHFMW